ncbi:hypothetical protein MNAN1_003118 [Malassezia nana]|uniref:Uncharacterized protein n=1 Tax=Malassezia nana TaxID=180528 RepID=A0AAF0ETI9_9BASI|nr:hypothetical protein MNAN1_003118 [Malassezia nana]
MQHDDALQMRPRRVQADATAATYVDRAALRRAGSASAEDHAWDARLRVASQAKGLDKELLAQERARIAREAEAKADPPQDTESEAALQAAFEEGRRSQEKTRDITARIAAARAKFRRMGEEPDIIYVDGKRMRRKRKASQPEPPAPTPALPSSRAGPAQPPAFAVHVDNADDDIFGEADVWAGLPDEASPPEMNSDAVSQTPAAQAPAPSAAGWVPETQPDPAPREATPEPPEETSHGPERLEGLSTSALPSEWSRWMLERAAEPRPERAAPRPRRRRRGRDASASP